MSDKDHKVVHTTDQFHRFSKTIDGIYLGVYFDITRFERSSNGGTVDKVRIARYSDGALSFSDTSGEAFIYFYPDQVKELRRIVGLPKPRKPTKRQAREARNG